MKRWLLIVLIAIACVLIVAEVGYLLTLERGNTAPDVPAETSTATQETSQETETSTESETQSQTEPSASESEPETTSEPEIETTQETTVPVQTHFILSFVGDCTLGSQPKKFMQMGTFVHTIGEDYGYPFRNVAYYFENDDFTIANLEGVLADSGAASDKTFVFRGPTAYTAILTESSVEAVTVANNHTYDFGADGYASTVNALKDAGVSYVEKGTTAVYTTQGGLVIGIYGTAFNRDDAEMKQAVTSLRAQGADIIIAAVHWGKEGAYHPDASQTDWAHAMIDAGVDIVYGHHSHVLQPIEEYKGGYIFYSLGNFSFGGNHFPRDMDTAVLQVDVFKNEGEDAVLATYSILPCSLSSMPVQNNFQPTPYEIDSPEYARVLSKLDGTYKGADLTVDYTDVE